MSGEMRWGDCKEMRGDRRCSGGFLGRYPIPAGMMWDLLYQVGYLCGIGDGLGECVAVGLEEVCPYMG